MSSRNNLEIGKGWHVQPANNSTVHVMKIAIMQPYLFPYIGYFQLISAVDIFVIYDDVNYITRGWINRNRILLNGKERLFTLRLMKASQNRLINEIEIDGDPKNRRNIFEMIRHAYAKAPFYREIEPVIRETILSIESNLSRFLAHHLITVSRSIGIGTDFVFSSGIDKNNLLTGQDKIIDIVKRLKADQYVNPIGGTTLYNKKRFSDEGIRLHFINTNEISYRQSNNVFMPNLSIIDALMFNGKRGTSKLLHEYTLLH